MKANSESLLDITMAVTTAQLTLDAGTDAVDPLLLKAVYDTNPSLTEHHLFGMDSEALQGAVNTAKGKYFEYLVVERLNNGEQVGPLLLHSGQHAVLAESMTQPGWDLQIVDAHGTAVEYLQLKATDSLGYVKHALDRYPDFQILGTHEVVDGHLILDSGISNHDLQYHAREAVDAAGTTIPDSFLDYFNPLVPLAIVASYEGYRLSVGKQSFDQFKMALARRGQRVVAAKVAGASVYALGGGYLAIPASFAGGLLFDRYFNQAALMTAFANGGSRLLALRLLQQERVLKLGYQ